MGTKRKDKPTCRVEAYARAVVEGKIVAGRLVRLACERHLRDLQTAAVRGLYWDQKAAEHAQEFFEKFSRHSKGEWAGVAFVLSDWQAFIVGSLFGWKRRADGTRRFRVAYNEIARKNGKSTLAAGIGLYLFMADGEPGAEIYSAATKRDQARIVHGEAVRMVRKSPDLKKRVGIFKDNLHFERTESKYEPLGADADTMDGLNVAAAIVDELHAHRTRAVWDVLETATGARRQPLIFGISTAGTDQNSICWEVREDARKVLEGTTHDDTLFAYIATIDDEDDWKDERCWVKANPNLGSSVKIDDMRRKAEKAKRLPAAQNAFLQKHLNRWTQQVSRWIPLDLWDANAGMRVDEEALAGRRCFGGLDLSSVSDLTAWVMVFPHEEDPETIDVACRFWCPEARLTDDANPYKDHYQAWARYGLLKPTPGNAIDYEFVKAQVLADAQRFALVDLNIDRLFQAYQVGMQLQEEGLTVVGMGQGFLSMAVPMKEFERRLLAKKIHHGGHPVLRWMADNVAVRRDPVGNLKPDKAKSQGKIDGIVALVMALDRAMRHQGAGGEDEVVILL